MVPQHTCRLCNHSLKQLWQQRDAKTRETLTMALCGHCGLVQQAQLPTDDELRIYYSHHYREDYKSTHQPKPKYVHRAGQAAKDRLAFMQRAGIEPTGKRLLDVGAGGGEFCYMAKRAGFAAQGIEPHQGYSAFARQAYDIEVKTCGIAEAGQRQADVVTLFHVFEHLAHPLDVMRTLHGLIAEGGHLVIEVPNIHQADASPHNVYFKAHLFYYSRHSLLAAASQWFEPVHIEDKGNLFVAFKRRNTPLDSPVWPQAAQVQETQQRLAQKGWAEYLTAGGGLKKPFKRVAKAMHEREVKRLSPRLILDRLHAAPNPPSINSANALLAVVAVGAVWAAVEAVV